MGDHGDPFMRNQNAAVQARTKAQNRANVLQLKLMGQSHPTGLTANLLKLFEPRPPLDYKPPLEKRKCPPLTGMGQFVEKFAEPGDPEYAPPVQEAETPTQRRSRIHKLRLEKGAEKAAEELKKYDPNNDPSASGDPYKTLFVARLSYEATESRIKREFESYGSIKRVRLVTDKLTNKPKGYAFIEYMHTRDMKAAYKQADGRKIDGRRVLVDVERGRTVPNWRPRRLGGGLGTSRVGNEEVSQQHVGRDQQLSRSSQSAEPRTKDERDREKSRERGRNKDRERSRERSGDRGRDRDHKEDRHHRDRDRARDRDKERERDSGRDRERDRGRNRDRTRDHERERDPNRDRDHGRHRDRDRDYDGKDTDIRSRDMEFEYDRAESKHERDHHGEKEHEYENEDEQGWYEKQQRGNKLDDPDHSDHYGHHQGSSKNDNVNDHGDYDRYNQYPNDQMEDDYHKDRAKSESRDRERTDREHRRSKRSGSKDYEY